ncbi:VOC family protein [Bacillus suaedaesalsae]|uniref:VOC family protein n=1 Tax=Bacillus suaedaesalsae TaxID=2810349 RepID=A0ABS2DDJ6_9BACI|nr:VOC family protein [Bacillus suaedaesalsae]MBM6616529.1 VOC family protein [Bacillus suaedaesalsae]
MRAHHIGIFVNDLEQSEQFYTLFGYDVEYRFTLNEEEISFMSSAEGKIKIELIKAKDVTPIEGTIHLAWEVNDFEKALENLSLNGLHPIEGPLSLHNGWKTAFYQGPNEEVIEILCGACHYPNIVEFS